MASASQSATATATAAESRTKRKRRRVLATAIVAFVISTIILLYARLIPLPFPRTVTTLGQLGPIKPAHEDIEEATLTMAHHKDKDAGLTRLATLPAAHLPTPVVDSPRLIIVGDVHGQLSALEALLRKTGFSRSRGDHVVFAGDLVNKGPDSGGVVDLAMSIRASAVRGNHEDRVLRAWEWEEERRRQRKGKGKGKASSDEDDDEDEMEAEEEEQANGKKKSKNKKHKKGKHHKPAKEDRKTAASLTSPQRAWLASLPVILRIGPIPSYADDVLVVHGGLVPGLPLADQNLQAVMNVRSLVRRRHLRKGWRDATFLDKEDTLAALRGGADSDAYSEDDDDDGDDEIENSITSGGSGEEEDDDDDIDYDYDAPTQKHLTTPTPAPETRHARPFALVPSGGHHGRPWAAAWNALQQRRRRRRHKKTTTAVIYGHDARTGLAVRDYTLGLDTNCARGGELTAAVFEAVVVADGRPGRSSSREEEEGGGEGRGEGDKGGEEGVVIKRRLVSVKCEEYWKRGEEGGGKGVIEQSK